MPIETFFNFSRFLQDTCVKGEVSRDFLPLFFFHESNPSGPLINRLKWFFLKIRLCESFEFFCECLSENEFLSKTIFACFLGAQMASIHEIKNGKKSRDTAPFKWRKNCENTLKPMIYGSKQ